MKLKKYHNVWKSKDCEIISCDEKLKVLEENLSEVNNVLQNAYDDAILIGCDESDLKKKFQDSVNNLNFSFKK